MRVAVVTDIHANLPAFEAVVAAVEAERVDQVWCLGDLVGYGADPDACVELARERCDLCLVGNHDLAVIDRISISSFSPSAAEAVRWTRGNISSPSTDYLANLPAFSTRNETGLYHASPRDPIWEYVLSTEQAAECLEVQATRISIIGHSHIALFFREITPGGDRPSFRLEAHGAQAPGDLELDTTEGRWLLNPGSVGQPRDSDPRAAWLELDLDRSRARYHRVDYDIDRAAASIMATSLPDHLARRLYVGR